MRKFRHFSSLGLGLACFLSGGSVMDAAFLNNSYLAPPVQPAGTFEYHKWDYFTEANLNPNNPTFSSPVVASPPVIRQTNPGAAIIAAGSNIYGLSGPLRIELTDSTSYTLGTTVFQFQVAGSEVDLSDIKIVYNGGASEILASQLGETVQYIREYTYGGDQGHIMRGAIQWDLTSLGITNYQIVMNTPSHSSLQDVLLDTSAAYATTVPKSRTWIANGAGTWSGTTNWQQGATTVTNGNARFANTGASIITLDGARTVGEVIFTGGNITLNGSVLTANTGITAAASTSGMHTINSGYAMGAYNIFDIGEGTTVKLNGVVSGGYGISKEGPGTLELNGVNTFTTADSGVTVNEGTLRVSGTNVYSAATRVIFGTLIVANDSTSTTRALGSVTSNIVLGPDPTLFDGDSAPGANVYIEGDHTISKNIFFRGGTFGKLLGAFNTTNGATYSGTINLSDASNVTLEATAETDRVIFTTPMTNGASTAVTIGGQGTVEFNTASQVYNGPTMVSNGATLRYGATSGYSGNGNVTVNAGGELNVNGILAPGSAGTATLVLNGGKLSGTGTVQRSISLDAGDTLSPGNSIGTLNTNKTVTLGGGGQYLLEINDVDAGTGIGADFFNITGALNITASSATPFVIDIHSLALNGSAGAVHDFNTLGLYDWIFLTSSLGITGFDASDFVVDLGDFTNPNNGNFSVVQLGNSLALRYSGVPEPSRVLLLAGALTVLFLRRTRKL